MRTPLAVALPVLMAASALVGGALPARATSISLCSDHVRWADHHDPEDARIAITTEDNKVTLLLTNRVVAMQLSERTLRKVRREFRDKERRQRDNPFGMAIVAVVLGTVDELIDNSFECRLRDLRDVSYRHGRLRFVARDGAEVFEDSDFEDTDVLSSFSEEDARAFVREFRRLKSGD